MTSQAYLAPIAAAPAVARPLFGTIGRAALTRMTVFAGGVAETGAAGSVALAAGAFAALGIIFIPSAGPKGQWVHLGGPANISYYRNPDELGTKFKYTTADGKQRTVNLTPDHNGDYRDPDGNILARTLKAAAKTGIVVSTAELVGDQPGQPQLCPEPLLGRNQGPNGKPYEAYMKARLNDPHTPEDLAYYFHDPVSGRMVEFDDCDLDKPGLHEYKGPGYLKHMKDNNIIWNIKMIPEIQKQSLDQVNAAQGTPLIWSFAEEPVANYFRKMFKDLEGGRQNIEVKHEPMPEHRR